MIQQMTPLPLPIRGFSEASAYGQSSPEHARASVNVLPWDPQEGVLRLGPRAPVVGWWDFEASDVAEEDSYPVQWMGSANVYISGTLTEVVIFVHRGIVYRSAGTGNPAALDSGTAQFGADAEVQGCIIFGKLYLTDGTSSASAPKGTVVYDLTSATPTASRFNPPSYPTGSGTTYPRVMTQWGTRLFVGGPTGSPNNWFASGINDPTDWTTVNLWNSINGATQASDFAPGHLGKPITGAIAFGEGGLVMFGRDSISLLTGDPAVGEARLIVISPDVGVPGGPNAVAHGDGKDLWVLATNGLYRLTPNQFRVEESTCVSRGRIDRLLSRIQWDSYRGCLVWDPPRKGLWIFVTPRDSVRGGIHLFYDTRTDSFWPMRFRGPLWDGARCWCRVKSSSNSALLTLMGGQYGRVERFSDSPWRGYDGYPDGSGVTNRAPAAIFADGAYNFPTSVTVGPISSPNHNAVEIMSVGAVLDEWKYLPPDAIVGDDSFDYPTVSIASGKSAEAAIGAAASTDDIEIERLSETVHDGGDAGGVRASDSDDGGVPGTVETGPGSGFFVDEDLDGGPPSRPTGTFVVVDPKVSDPLDLEWRNATGWTIYAGSESTGIDDRVWEITAPSVSDVYFTSRAGSMGVPGDPVVLVGNGPIEATVEDEDRLQATQAVGGARRVVVIGTLHPGRNDRKRRRVKAQAIAVTFAASGFPMILDSVAVELRAEPGDTGKKWSA